MVDLQDPAIKAQAGLHGLFLPRPHIAKPDRRQHIEWRRLRAAIVNGDPDDDVFCRCFGVFDEHIKVSIRIKNTGVCEIEFGIQEATAAILIHQLIVRERCLWVLVQRLHVGVRWGGVEIVIKLLHVFPVIALRATQSKQTLLQNRILMIPKRQCEAHSALPVCDA